MKHDGRRPSAATMQLLEPRRLLALFAPDVSFGNGGSTGLSAGSVIEPLPDGKIYVVGQVELPPVDLDSGGSTTVASRLNPDGTLDTSFGNNGQIDAGRIGSPTYDGSTLYTSDSTNTVGEIRAWTTQFEPATSFSGDGVLPLPFVNRRNRPFSSVDSEGIAVAPNGDLIVQVQISYTRSASPFVNELVRINPSGTVDTAFGLEGFLPLPDPVSDVALVSTRGIYMLNGRDELLTRYRLDGSGLDTTFGGGDGIVDVGNDFIESVTEQPDGKILFTARPVVNNVLQAVRVYRLDVDGSTDTTFGDAGSVSVDSPRAGVSDGSAILLDEQGRILVVASASLFRFSADGTPEAAPFNGTIPFPAGNLAFDNDGRLLVGAYIRDTNEQDFMRFDEAQPVEVGRDGVLYVTGDPAADVVTVAPGAGGSIDATVNGVTSNVGPTGVVGINLRLFDGDNDATVSFELPTTVNTEDGDDTVRTSDADDRVLDKGGNNTLDVGDGDDAVQVIYFLPGLEPETDEHIVIGGDGDKDVTITSGNSTVTLGTGNNTIDLGSVRTEDSVTVAGGSNRVEINSKRFSLTIGGDGDNRVVFNFSEAATITTGDGDDEFLMGGGANINSNGGNDLITLGSGGGGRIDVGAGDDRVLPGNSTSAHPATVHGGNGDDLIVGDVANQRFYGDAGNDTIEAGDGDNTVYGGDGNDSIKSGAGLDRIFGDAGGDLVKAGRGNDRVSGGAGRDRLFGQQGHDRISGTNHFDVLDGGPNNDTLLGLGGIDLLYGRHGDDTLDGGAEVDAYDGGHDQDLILAADGNAETLFGGSGDDRGFVDTPLDLLVGLEQIL